MITDQHIEFARKLVALAREHDMSGLTLEFQADSFRKTPLTMNGEPIPNPDWRLYNGVKIALVFLSSIFFYYLI